MHASSRMWARSLLVAPLLALLAACGDTTPPDRASDGVELPVVGVLGPLPPASGRVTIEIDKNGALAVDGRACPWEALEERLVAVQPEAREWKGVPGLADEQEAVQPYWRIDPRSAGARFRNAPSNMDLLLRVDRRVPWLLVVRVLVTCAHPELRMVRTFFAVRGADGRGEGSLGLFLPRATCGASEEKMQLPVHIRWRQGAARATDELAAQIALRRDDFADIGVDLDGDPLLPVQHVLTTVEAALLAGALSFVLDDPDVRGAERTPQEWCRAAQAVTAWRYEIREPAAEKPVAEPHVEKGRFDHYVGFDNDTAGMLEFAEEEEEEEAEEASGR